jgi:four helix bundle protein
MSVIRTYRDLVAWSLGMKLARAIYKATQQMPKSELFGLTNQMRRAVVSIPSNIAEGYCRQSTADYLKYLRIARGSLGELSTQVELSMDLKMLDPNRQVSDLMAEEDRVLQGLIRSLERKKSVSE